MLLTSQFQQKIPDLVLLKRRRELFRAYRINTVCASAHCPNVGRCIEANAATFMILGNVCSRKCFFCAVDKGAPEKIDQDEPRHIAYVVREMGLDYTVITSPSRDDLPDFGAGHFVNTISAIRALNPRVKIEALIPDFCGSIDALEAVVGARPDCIGHNLETVARLYPSINRSVSAYVRSLAVISAVKKNNPDIYLKSGIMLGLGEEKYEVVEALGDLRSAGCDVTTLGQYLAPSPKHFPVKRFLDIAEFSDYKQIASDLGFAQVLSGPLVRSSYKAKEVYGSLVNTQ